MNAKVEHCPIEGNILFKVHVADSYLIFTVSDNGKGFSKESLQFASQQFYMGDSSRANKGHYGMGLYITKNIVMQHNGLLDISNSTITGRGEVTIKIPYV